MIGTRRGPDLRLAIPALVTWIVTAVAIGTTDARPLVLSCVLGAIAATVGAVVGARRSATARSSATHGSSRVAVVAFAALPVAALALGLSALAVTSVAAQQRERLPPVLAEAARSGRTVALVAEQTAAPVERRVAVRIRALTVGGQRVGLDSPALLFASPPRGSRIGSVLALNGAVRAADPGDDIAVLVFARGGVTVSGAPPPLLAIADDLRGGLSRLAATLPGDGGRLLPGLAVGDTSRVDPSLAQAMKGASLTHLTAVSGANCAVVVALAAVVVGALGGSRTLRIAAGLGVLAGFVVLVTPQPSVLRAATMAALVLIALAVGRPVQGLPLLGAAVVVLLVVDPWLARDYGFVLSVLATGGLLLLAAPIAARLSRWVPRWLALALSVPLAAQLACQPVLLMLTPTVPLYGVPANLLAEPAAPIATVLGLLACVLAPIAPPIASAIAAIAWVPAAWIAAVARAASALPGAQLPWPPGLWGLLAMAVLTLGVLAVVLARRGVLRAVSVGVVAVTLAAGAGATVGGAVAIAAGRPGDWQYAMCDIGQGDSSVIRSGGEVALVDTGPEPPRLTSCLQKLGIARIDLLVLTHYDLDHVGGTSAVVGRVTRALVGPSSGADDDRVSQSLRAGGARVESVTRGLSGRLGQLDWRVIWPPPRGVEPGNAASVTLSVTPHAGCRGGCLTGLFLGDLGAESQHRLMGATPLGHYDVVKVAHHGSADQAPQLYARIRATVGLIGVGADNDYGHPTAFALGMLADAGTRALRTDRQGLLLVADRGAGRIAVWTERAPPGST